eukprot:Lithocolla_globosa_v1_NODE_2374_length_2031_cov_53.798077.p2 type:complete len:100 gc:universal NODE_2374_length_2031_cov_53.798077:1337-1038(-)
MCVLLECRSYGVRYVVCIVLRKRCDQSSTLIMSLNENQWIFSCVSIHAQCSDVGSLNYNFLELELSCLSKWIDILYLFYKADVHVYWCCEHCQHCKPFG